LAAGVRGVLGGAGCLVRLAAGGHSLVSCNPEEISVDLPWYGWLVLLAWATWLVGVIEHHRPRSQVAQPQPAGAPALPQAS
jgi:hypothetical protein